MVSATDEGQLASLKALSNIVETFPQDHMVFAFGYGSGVFSQTLGDDQKHEGMLDMIFVVDDACEFHSANVQAHPHHYATWLRYGGISTINRIQRNSFLKDAKVLFHVVDDPVQMKYGVVHLDDLLRDLTLWESLYLAGRLHKPTLPISSNPPDQLIEAQTYNLQAAVAAALLLFTPEDSNSISWSSFYSQIAALSYTGDFRMQVGGEDPLKISKLVQAPGQLERFQSLYEPILQPLETSGIMSLTNETLEWDAADPSTREHLAKQLPPNILENHTSVNTTDLAKILATIVAPAARNQSFKGIFTLGFRRSMQYASAKLSKGLLRK